MTTHDIEHIDAFTQALFPNGAVDELVAVLATGVDVHVMPGDFRSPLMYALLTCQIDKARVLLQHGADPNRYDETGRFVTSSFGIHRLKVNEFTDEQAREETRKAYELLKEFGADLTLRNHYAFENIGEQMTRIIADLPQNQSEAA